MQSAKPGFNEASSVLDAVVSRGLRRATRRMGLAGLLGLGLSLGACSDDDGGKKSGCTVGTQEGCEGDAVCEETVDGEPACYAPVVISGRVFTLIDDEAIEGATVVALDANGAARSRVARSDVAGHFAVTVSQPRDEAGLPAPGAVTLRAAAAAHRPFPEAPRQAIALDLSTAVRDPDDGPWRLENVATDVGLFAVPDAQVQPGSIVGRVDADHPGGVLVVAEVGGKAVSTAITDADGDFWLFNLPVGDVSLKGYRIGLYTAERAVTVKADEVAEVVLDGLTTDLSTVSGSVSIVNAPGGSTTSVILAVASTYDPNVRRADAPAGLRITDVGGAWHIDDVPPGTYVVLAAFENDDLVRDPDESIGGTATVQVTVADGEPASVAGFKITEALDVIGPGADGIEIISGLTPTLRWADDASEDGYELRVYDGLGIEVFADLDVPRVTGSADVTYPLTGASLVAGGIYQFRVLSYRDGRGADGGRGYISASEDLKGVFQVAGAAR